MYQDVKGASIHEQNIEIQTSYKRSDISLKRFWAEETEGVEDSTNESKLK